MEPLSTTDSAVLRRVLEAQPTTPAKIAFAWRMSAGPALGRATTIDWNDGVVRVRADGEAWKREVRVARSVLLRRMQDLLGAEVVARLVIE